MISRRQVYSFAIASILLMVSGCAVNRATASLTPGTDLNKINSIYVLKSLEDERDINQLIKENLIRRGYAVTTGVDPKPTAKVDTVLTYVDKWFWDITMYMLELTITLRNPDNNFPLAVGNSYHTSISRKSKEEMVDEVLDNIFKTAKKPSSERGREQ
jgi:hypothetical protein